MESLAAVHNRGTLLFNFQPSEQHAALLKCMEQKNHFHFHLSESQLLCLENGGGGAGVGRADTCKRHSLSSEMCLSLLLLQLLQVFSYSGCLGQQGRIQPVISTAAAAAAAACCHVSFH